MSDWPPAAPTQTTPPARPGEPWPPAAAPPTEPVPPVPPEQPPWPPSNGGGGGGGGGGDGGGAGGGAPGGGGWGTGAIVAIVVLALAILGVGGYLLLSDDEDDVAVEQDETTTTSQPEETTTSTESPTTTSSTSTSTTSTTTTAPADELVFTPVTDDTGQLVVEVPQEWSDVDGRSLDDGAPNVQASTDLDEFRQLAASGISYTLLNEADVDPDETLDFLISSHVDDCDVEERQPYDDTVFVGRLQVLSDCGGQGITLVAIVATNPQGQSVEVSTVVVPPDPADPIVNRIIETFNVRS